MIFFFFSSRRRHTRSLRDWSSDVCSSDLGEERKLVKQLASNSNKLLCNLNRFLSLFRRSCVCGQVRISQLVAAASKVRKRPENLSKLGSDCAFDRIMTATSGAQSLLRQESDASEPCGVIGQDVGAIGVDRDQPGRRSCSGSCLREQRNAVSLRTSHCLQFPVSDELLYYCLASRPPTHRLAPPVLETRRLCHCRLA